MTVVLGPGSSLLDTSRHVLFATSNWLDTSTTIQTSVTPEPGTILHDLKTRQPQDVVGFNVSVQPLQLYVTRTTAAPIDVIALLRTNATSAATWFVGVGDSPQEAVGDAAADSSGHAQHGALQGVPHPQFIAGKYGGALWFDGETVGQCVLLPSIPTVSFTWMAWVKLDYLPTSTAVTLMFQAGEDAATVDLQRGLAVAVGGVLGFEDNRGGDFFSTAALTPRVWQHVALTYDVGTGLVTLYLDGDAIETHPETAYGDADADTFDVMYVGGNPFQAPIPGTIDDVRFYGRALTGAEIQAENQSETSAFAADLLGHWRLNGYQTGRTATNFINPIPFGAPPNDPDAVLRDGVVFLPYPLTASVTQFIVYDPTNPLPLRIGRAFAGAKLVPSKNFDWGYEFTAETATKVTVAPSGAKLTVERPVHEGFTCSLHHLTRTEALGDFHKLRQQLGTARELLLCADPGDDTFLQAQLFYCQFKDLMTLAPDYYNGWRVSVAVEALG
jgi:hypothetical protein